MADGSDNPEGGEQRPASLGLYESRFEHDACGFGLIASLDHEPKRSLIDAGLTALERMAHRGAVGADGKSGDGCGVLLSKPEKFLRHMAAEVGLRLGPIFAAGNVFLSRDPERAAVARERLKRECERVEVRLIGWRDLPIDLSPLGDAARASLPDMQQVFVQPTVAMDQTSFQRALFLARRRTEIALAADKDFYVVSLSAQSLGYKAMVLPANLPVFYPDLRHPLMAASFITFHQRFSTNTAPRWPLAQPFRYLAHNGEINTIEGNRHWAEARSSKWRTPAIDLRELKPLVSLDGSDSMSLDNMLEVLLIGGMELIHAMRVLIPPATGALEATDPDLAAFYDYHSLSVDPWDGPAAIVLCDGRYAACTVDRNGLRPARWLLTEDRHLMVASESGVFDVPAASIVKKGKLGPGEMVAADLYSGELLDSSAIDAINRARAPFKRWLKQGSRYLTSDLIDPALAAEPFTSERLLRHQKLFQLTREEREDVLRVLAETEQEAVGSMGDDTPLAVLSELPRSLYDYFRQAFAQVTNPPIDPLREQCVMSLVTQIGREGNVFEMAPENARQIMLNSPVLSQRKLRQILAMDEFVNAHERFRLYAAPELGLKAALEVLCARVEESVRAGTVIVILSDLDPEAGLLPMHALLATGAVHEHLVKAGLRCECNLIIETGTARDPHHFACLIGYGATAVYPYLAYQTLLSLGAEKVLKPKRSGEATELGRSFRRGIKKGLLKIISKMGISTIGSYRGARLFEIIGLKRDVVDLCFAHTPSRVGGAGFKELEQEALDLLQLALDPAEGLEAGSLLKYRHGGEYHMFNPEVVQNLQRAVMTGDFSDYQRFADAVNERPPSTLRDLLELKVLAEPIPLSEVEPVELLLKRFDSAGMSLGALSPEAHEALAIAMNRLGGRSNSGEGGEDPARYGTEKSSKIKQVASGRFGVTPEYLINAEVLQIKVAQGAKPGEGGQLPGHKVNDLIARLRYARPGIGLISPPPHHDIYSIEDLAQLIFDLKQINPEALVSVKLVAHAGIGTVVAGVAKAYADLVTISGYDGGTGASPISSIKYAGTPWEMGLAEARQTLRQNGLRSKVRLQIDGGLKTGLDVVKAALLGADSFGFGTVPMIALGCKYLRICHLNNCATGVATQDERLREQHFTGLPERVMNYFQFVAEETRHWLAKLGARSLEEIIGRTDLLRVLEGDTAKQHGLDLRPLLANDALVTDSMHCAADTRNPPRDPALLAKRMLAELRPAIVNKSGGEFAFEISNRDRSIGAGISGLIARHHGNHGMQDKPLYLRLHGHAGQSFGAFNAGGLNLYLEGDANDYVGKGMSDGKIVLRPPQSARYVPKDTPIMGNTCLYGATGGELYAAGRAGERFAVRNSGATAVIEGAGDHCCEYMTGGVVVVLGSTGMNFGAGFTGGLAYVLDLDRNFVDRYNHELIDILRLSPEGMEHHLQHLKRLVTRHVFETESSWGRTLLTEYRDFVGKFWLVKPKAASLESLIDSLKRAA
ncbi:glutamate synthase large subunit [Ahniella affigens]|uniref:Glutamate synthase large subunit n=1 Tax=Ahniella affigens TaxID=2021234 RepID=A0A2P1PS94_9GAMM|nr:glutamate synthase large subunit [Ahniella affigens]AVP97708.1 glutamate synthase large subunit [Ahniella affigens]